MVLALVGLLSASAPAIAAAVQPEAAVGRAKVAPGQRQQTAVRGFQAGEIVTATDKPNDTLLGSQAANPDGTAAFEWIISDDDTLGSHVFLATGPKSGVASARYVVVATAAEAAESDDSGPSPWLIVLIVLAGLAGIAAAVSLIRAGIRSRKPPATL